VLQKKITYYIAAVILLASLVPLQRNIDDRRVEEKLVVEHQTALPSGEAAIGLLLAGFRGMAANMLWFRTTILFEEGRVTEEIPLFQAISYLQPRFRSMWSFGAWHIAYNVSAHFFDREDLSDAEVDEYRYRCFEIAEEFLRRGIKHNYYYYDLHWDLGFSILYYKKYKLIKEKGWPERKEALLAALEEMRIASLFREVEGAPLAKHPAYVERIIAIVMREGGMLDNAYKMWYRLKTWPAEDQNMGLVNRHMSRVLDEIESQQTKAYALELEQEGNVEQACQAWYSLLAATKQQKTKLAEDKFADPKEAEQINANIDSYTQIVASLEEELKRRGVNLEPLRETALEKGSLPLLRERIDNHFRSLEDQATREFKADKAETVKMYRELTKPAPKLDWWVLLLIPLLLLAAGYLIGGREVYAS
jgi:hypothetical protein